MVDIDSYESAFHVEVQHDTRGYLARVVADPIGQAYVKRIGIWIVTEFHGSVSQSYHQLCHILCDDPEAVCGRVQVALGEAAHAEGRDVDGLCFAIEDELGHDDAHHRR